MIRQTVFLVFRIFFVIVSCQGLALAMGSDYGQDSMATKQGAVDLSTVQASIDAKDWPTAIVTLLGLAEKHPQNADVFNLIGYSYRKTGDFSKSLAYYGKALSLDPDHRGAHEYIGSAYVEMGDLDKAREHLERLKSICWFGCKEYTALKRKVDAAAGS